MIPQAYLPLFTLLSLLLAGVVAYCYRLISRRHRQNIELIRRQKNAAESLYEIGTIISRFGELDDILDHAVQETQRLMKSEFTWYITWPDRSRLRGVVRSAAGRLPDTWDADTLVPLGGRALALLDPHGAVSGDAYILVRNLPENLGEGPPGHPEPDGDGLFCDPQMHALLTGLGVGSGIVVPVGTGSQVKGLLCSFSLRVDAYDMMDVDVQRRIAIQMLIAANTAEVRKRGQNLAVMEERQRLSDELHDDMSQIINGLALELHALKKMSRQGVGQGALQERLAVIHERLDDARAAIRRAIFELRITGDSDLWANLRSFTTRFEQWHGLTVHVDTPGQGPDLPLDHQREVIRIVQEALWNVKKHSGTDEAWLVGRFERRSGSITVEVRDAGRGMVPDAMDAGQGLVTLRDRARRLGGELGIAGNGPHGVIVTLGFPHAQS